MKITAIQANNLRSFEEIEKTTFSDSINVFIGANNSGKSSILKSIYNLQRQVISRADIMIGKTNGEVRLFFKGSHPPLSNYGHSVDSFVFQINSGGPIQLGQRNNAGTLSWGHDRFSDSEPDNLIYPYLSKRKTEHYIDAINETNANSLPGNFANLYSKIDRLVTPQFQPGNREYLKACEAILGFEMSSLAKGGGKQAVYFIRNQEHVPLTSMGEGVANVLGLVSDLCVARDKIFLIEEPENDIHPKALKALLNLINEKSETNQFFVSTHSNIVMKYLGSAPRSKVFHIKSEKDRDTDRPNLYYSTLSEVDENPQERQQVLQDLGYDLFDFDLWSNWLFLEESSAERIVREHLIPWFVKPLENRIRTFAAGGLSEVAPKLEDFDRLFVFLHLQPAYKNRVWVIVDAGENESKVIEELKAKYSKIGWNPSHFLQFTEHDFELYYPKRFQKRVGEVLALGKNEKRKEKMALLNEVLAWIEIDPVIAKEEFHDSAKNVIEKLKAISKEIPK